MRFRLVPCIHVAFVVLTLALAETLCGQSTAGGSVTGTVQDPSGAVVPAASLVLTNNETKVPLATTSSSAGQFVFPVVPAGEYTLTTTNPGFAQSLITGVIVRLNQTTTITVDLKVGSTGSSVKVT